MRFQLSRVAVLQEVMSDDSAAEMELKRAGVKAAEEGKRRGEDGKVGF